jgi:uncharacterized protein YndB with AHSA1/START domain
MTIAEGGDGTATIERCFDAPRELVFRLLTDPSLISEWWGPRSVRTRVNEMDFRVGGRWSYSCISPDGPAQDFSGEYLEIDPPNGYTQTFEWAGAPGHVSTERLELQEQDGGTLMRVTADYGSVAAAEAAIGSGMEQGASETYDRLEELLDHEAVGTVS